MPRSRTGLAHDENVLLVRGRFVHPSRIPLDAHAPALRSYVSRRTQLDVRRLLRQESSHPSAGGAGCVGEAARPRARVRSIPRRSTVHAIHAREPDRGTCLHPTGVSATYLRPIEIFPPPKHGRKIFWREGRNGGGGCGGKSDPLIRPRGRTLDWGWSTGEVRSGPSIPRGSQRPSCLSGLSSVFLPAAFRGTDSPRRPPRSPARPKSQESRSNTRIIEIIRIRSMSCPQRYRIEGWWCWPIGGPSTAESHHDGRDEAPRRAIVRVSGGPLGARRTGTWRCVVEAVRCVRERLATGEMEDLLTCSTRERTIVAHEQDEANSP